MRKTVSKIDANSCLSSSYVVSCFERFLRTSAKRSFIENFVVTQTAVAESDLIGIVSSTYGSTRRFRNNFALLDLDVFPPLNMGVAQQSRRLPSRSVRACLAAVRKFPPDAEA